MRPIRVPGLRDRASTGLVGDPADDTRQASFAALPPKLATGDRLGQYRILKDIRVGTNSGVYEATDGDRRVALKVIAPQLALHDSALERFHAEISIAERVSHPSLLPIYAAGEDRGHHYFAMRLESGQTVQSLVGQGGSSESFYVHVAREMARIAFLLAELHSNGIVHRDIKPSNVLIDRDGSFVLSDFGSALDSNHRISQLEDNPGGTVLYLSPEQLRPKADPYDPAGDVYSLGATLYEVCAGSSAFPRVDEHELARLKLTRIPPRPRRLNRHVPLPIEAAIVQAMSIEVSQRQSIESLGRELERFVRRRDEISRRR